MTLFQFFDCFFNYVNNNLDKTEKKESFLEDDKIGSKFSLEQSIRFLMDNLNEQILWLEEKTLSDKKNNIIQERERLIVRILVRMFQILESKVGCLKELDTLCLKNLFSYVRLKNKTLTGKSKMIDSKSSLNNRPFEHDLHLLHDSKIPKIRAFDRFVRNDEQTLNRFTPGKPDQMGVCESFRNPICASENPVHRILDSKSRISLISGSDQYH